MPNFAHFTDLQKVQKMATLYSLITIAFSVSGLIKSDNFSVASNMSVISSASNVRERDTFNDQVMINQAFQMMISAFTIMKNGRFS